MKKENHKKWIKSTQISIKTTIEEKQLLISRADSEGISPSELFRRMLREPYIGANDIAIKLNKKQRDLLNRIWGDFSMHYANCEFKEDDLNYNTLFALITVPFMLSDGFGDPWLGKDEQELLTEIKDSFPEMMREMED